MRQKHSASAKAKVALVAHMKQSWKGRVRFLRVLLPQLQTGGRK